MTSSKALLTYRPVSKATRADFESLFNKPSAPKYCWCMAWRADKDELRHTKSPDRERQMLGRIDAGVPVGVLGYHGDDPVAWVSIAPRETYLRLGGPEAEEGDRIWSLVCMYARREWRHQGLAHELIDQAVRYARKHKATILEAYPVDPASPSYRFMGFVAAFERAGFNEVGREGTRRHVMRLTLKGRQRAKV